MGRTHGLGVPFDVERHIGATRTQARGVGVDGLDTFADVFLNDQPVLYADNMFRTWRVNAKPMLHPGANTLRIAFHSAIATMMPKVKAMAFKLPHRYPGAGGVGRRHRHGPVCAQGTL